MGWFDGLLGAGSGNSLYGDLFTPEQQRAMDTRGLLSMAGAFAKAGAPSLTPQGGGFLGTLGTIGSALGTYGEAQDAATQKALAGLLTTEKIKELKQTRQFQQDQLAELGKIHPLLAPYMGVSTPATPTPAPVAGPLATPAEPAAPATSTGPLAPGAPTPLLPPGFTPAAASGGRPALMPTSYAPPMAPAESGGGVSPLAQWAVDNARPGMPSSVEGVQGEFARRIQTMVADMPPNIAEKFKIISGFRDPARQAQVNPGVTNSRHSYGMAVDTTSDRDVLNWINNTRGRYGVDYTLRHLPNEANHLEMVENGARAPLPARGGPDTVIPSGAGLPASMLRRTAGPGGGTATMPAQPGVPASGNPAEAALLAIAGMRARAIARGLKDPFEPYMDALTKSPGFQGRVKEATEGVELKYAGPKADAIAKAQHKYNLALKEFEAQMKMLGEGRVFNKDTGTTYSVPGHAQTLEEQEAAKARGTASMDIVPGGTMRQGADGYFYQVPITRKGLADEITGQPNIGLPAAPGAAPAGPIPGSTMMPGPSLGGPSAAAGSPGGFAPGAIVGKRELDPSQTGLSGMAQEAFKAQHASAQQAAIGITEANNVLDILKRGALVGPGSDLKIGYKRFAQLVNEAGIADIRGANDQELLANTEQFVSAIGNRMVGILKSFVPASNVDVKAAERIAGSKEMTLQGLQQIIGYVEKHGRKSIIDYGLNLDETLRRSPVPNADSLRVREPPRHGANIAVDPDTGAQMWERSPGKWVRF